MIQKINLPGVSIEYLDTGEGEVLLLLHGLGSTKADWDKQIAPFSKKYRLIAPDFRGHGNSSKPKKSLEYGVTICAEDMKLLLDELDITKCSVIGFSMGGAVAFEMAIKYPTLFTKMIIVNTAPDFNNLGWFGKKMVWERTLSLKLRGMEPLANKVAKGMFPENKQEHLRQAFYNRAKVNDVNAYYNSFRTLMKWGIGEKIKSIKTLALVVASEMDYTPISLKKAYVDKMPNASLAVVGNSRHGVTMDQPEEFNRIILNFMEDE